MGITVPGEVRDFCREGLYLAFADARAAQAVSAWAPQARVEVSFTALDGERPRGFRIAGAVVHTTAGGLGLHVPSMPEEALQALQAASAGIAGRPSSATAGSSAASVQDECLRIFDDALIRISEEFFARIGDRLMAAAEKTANLRERQRLRDAPLLLGSQRARIHDELIARLREKREQLHSDPAPAAPLDEEPGELSLVDETQLEDSLNVASVAHQVETGGSFGRALAVVELRYGEAVGKALDRQNNPFGPLALCRAFQSATGSLELCQQGRSVVYKSFGEALSRHLPALYERLERALPAREEPRRPKRTAAPQGAVGGPSRPPEGEAAPGPAADGWDPRGWDSPAPAGPHPAGLPMEARRFGADGGAAGFGPPRQGLGQASGPAPGQGQGANPAGASGRAEASGPGLLRVADALLRAAADFEAGRPPPGWTPPRGAAATASAAPASVQDVAQAIDARMPADGTGPGVPAGLSLSDRISRAIEGLDVPAAMRQALDRTGSLMGHAMAVSGGGPAIDALLARLEQPLLKLSLNDGAFPGVPDHPARQVVDLLEQYAIAADDQGRFLDPKLQRFLQAAVERICTTADREPGVYAATRDSLARLYPPVRQARQTRIARLQEACEGRHRILQARDRVRAALERRLAGRSVPQVVLDLMDAGWRQHLVLQELRGGIGGDGWTQSLAVLDRLLSLLEPQPMPACAHARQELATLPSLIEQQLTGVNLDGEQREAVMATLTQALDAVVRHGRAPAAVSVALHARASQTEHAGGGAALAHAALLQRLRVGDWWHFLEAGKWQPMQLIWLSEPAGDCAFANRSATQKVDLTLAEFGKRLGAGEVRAWADQDLPLLERSVHAMMDDGSQRLQQRATHDAVTGLLSRKGFLQRLAQAGRQSPAGLAHVLGVIEFDQFRVVCQACGAEEGESLSRAMAAEVEAAVGTDAVLASLRDDTLAVFLPGSGREHGATVVERVLGRLRDYRYQAGEHSFSIGANIGLAEYDPGQHSPEAAVQQADMACVASKARGRNRTQFYEPDDLQLESQRSMIEVAGRLDSLLAGDGLYLRGQMVMPIGADASLLPYHEVLLGIDGGGGRPIKPLPFILGVERLQRAHEVDLWVLRRVFDWIRDNPFGFAAVGGFSINLSTMSLANPELIAYLHETLSRDDIPAGRISFEITETAAIECYAAAGDFIRQMRRYGCKFALDDFGSGHTSYAHLKNLRVDALKIDGSFVRDIVDSPSDFAIVKSMNDVAHSLGMVTVAEYVESPAILAKLREIGVDYAQGYAIHKPCRIDEIVVLEPA